MKKIFNLFLSLIFVFSFIILTGCHGKGTKLQEFEVKELLEFDDSKEYTISFWAKNDTNITQKNIYIKAIKEFQELYPNIKVEMKSYNDYNVIYQDVITNIATNTTPNVCITYPDHVATYMTGDNVIVKLDDLMNDKNYGLNGEKILFDSPKFDDIVGKFLMECRIDRSICALPFMRSTEALYINKNYVESLGFEIPDVPTWDFVFEVSKKALEEKPSDKLLYPFIYKSTDNMMIQMLYQNGYSYSTELGNVLMYNDDAIEVLKEVSLWAESGCLETFKRVSYPGNFFNAGECIFAIDSTAGATWMGSRSPLKDIDESKLVEFETVVRPVPQVYPESPQMISQGPSICLFNKEDKNEVIASWLFAMYLLSNNVQIPYSETEGYIPVTYKAQNSAEYKEYLSSRGELVNGSNSLYYSVKIDAANILLNNINNTFTTPAFNGSVSLRNAAGALIETTVKDSILGKKTIDDLYFKREFSSNKQLYKIDQIVVKDPPIDDIMGGGVHGPVNSDTNKTEKEVLGILPKESIILIVSILVIWVLIGLYYFRDYIKKLFILIFNKNKEKE